jgi:hypothetical protein
MSYGIVRLDRVSGTKDPAKLISAKYLDGATETAIDNGNFIRLNGILSTTNREVFKGVKPAANTALSDVALVASVELMYDERKKNLAEFRNEAGDIVRGYILEKGDIFSVTADALSAAATIAVGNIVELQADTKAKVVTTLTVGSTQIGTVIGIETVGTLTYYVIRV